MSAQHTAGPWEYDVTEFGTAILAGRELVADGIGSEANARLIAAAPEMLTALRAAETAMGALLHYSNPILQAARAAIAKATDA